MPKASELKKGQVVELNGAPHVVKQLEAFVDVAAVALVLQRRVVWAVAAPFVERIDAAFRRTIFAAGWAGVGGQRKKFIPSAAGSTAL